MHRGHLALTRGVLRYSNEARCVGTRCCEGPEAIAACSTRGRGSREEIKVKSTFPHLLKYVGKACTVLLYDKLK